jgi:hypothetical protein
MKNLAIVLLALLVGCSSAPEKDPTPFETSAAVQDPYGCQLLKKEVDEYNKTHKDQKKADC